MNPTERQLGFADEGAIHGRDPAAVSWLTGDVWSASVSGAPRAITACQFPGCVTGLPPTHVLQRMPTNDLTVHLCAPHVAERVCADPSGSWLLVAGDPAELWRALG